MESGLVIELKTACVHIVYFVGLTPVGETFKSQQGSPEINSHGEKSGI
jgi:hypothetical protein